ncbi:MAG: hypothetical protein ACI4U4_04240 [Bacilli bacterium]
MKKLNRRGYLTIEIILGSVIAFAIAFFLIEITVKMVSNNDDTFRDTIITTDNALIISGVKEVVENNKDGINNINCNDNNICTITYFNDDNIGTLKIEDHTVKYEKVNPNDTTIGYDKYEKELDSSLSDIKLTSNITGEVSDESNIYFKITGKNIFLDKEYNIIIPIDNLKKNNVCNTPSVTSSTNLVNYITTLYNNGEKEIVTNNNIEYNTISCLGLMNDRLGGTTSNYDDGNIRYYGENPNNYIYFNCDDYNNQTSSTCELWRIIGVFEGKVKIMKNESIGDYPYDNKDTSTGAETDDGKNDWTDARLMKLLNPGYESETIGGSLYYNSGSGSCYTGLNNATSSCDFTSTGLKNNITRNMISDTLYHLGGAPYSAEIYSNQAYTYERGTEVYEGNATTWRGKIVLAYLSDYGYAADLGSCTQNLYNYDNSNCTSVNWMEPILGTSSQGWLLTPVYWEYQPSLGWYVYLSGNVNAVKACSLGGVAPVLYLDSNVDVKSGNGTIDNPYQIFLNLV